MEMLIVIVVIAILAAIGFVTYGTIRRNAYDAKVDLALNQAEKLVIAYDRKNKPGKDPSLDVHFVKNQMIQQGYIDDKFINQLKDFSPMRAYGMNNRDNWVRILWCGGHKYLITAEAYSNGIPEDDYYDETDACHHDNSVWNSSFGGGTGHTSTDKPRYFRIKSLDLSS